MDFSSVSELPLWLRGMALGLALSAPVGPIGLLCIRRTIDRGPFTGLATGLGAALADTLYATLAAFGISAILGFLTHYDQELRIFGGIIMMFMARSIYKARPTTPANAKSANNLLTSLMSGFALTFTNPVTVLATIALVATLAGGDSKFESFLLVIGVFAGAAGWWCILVAIATAIRDKFTIRTIIHLNRFTGILLCVFGFGLTAYSVAKWFNISVPDKMLGLF